MEMRVEKKVILPAVTIALLSCIALMLTVIGGLYMYNTFADDAAPAYAQGAGTDKGPSWSATPVTVGGNQEMMVVIREVPNPYEPGEFSTQMNVYEIRGQGGKIDLYFVGSRILEYDFRIPDHSGVDSKSAKYNPLGVKEAADEFKAAMDKRNKKK